MNTSFIEKLSKRKTNFPAPEEAIDKANALNALSKDIYTDNTRFIYELLQNADDASCKSGHLTLQFDFVGEYLIVSHKGKPFDEDDVESICSIGDGTKANDSEQTGFKGIGFKSVFAYSNLVIIKSGDFCFKFDREESNNYWNNAWGTHAAWMTRRKSKNKSVEFNMPWQIIPINTSVPQEIARKLSSDFTVSTIIKYKKINELKQSVLDLFSSSQLILFLRSKNVEITINANDAVKITKKTAGDVTQISKNGKIISQWLMHTTTPFNVPKDIRDNMYEDKDHYPEKLLGTTKASISFAVNIKDGKIQELDEECNNIFSFLPTTVTDYDFPFIVNSNFITDAGRQNLHQDYVWNRWLFEEMPKHYLKWMAKIAKEGKYGLDFLRVIAKTSGSYNELGTAYDQGMEEALQNIAILPNNGTLLKVDEAIYDKTTISSELDNNLVLSYIASKYPKHSKATIIDKAYFQYYSQIQNLGVFVFKEDELRELIMSEAFLKNQNVDNNIRLIRFLSNRYDLKDDSEEIILWLQKTPFILSNREKLQCPTQICFPSIKPANDDDIDTISKDVYKALSNKTISWLRKIGVTDISDTSLIDTGKLFEEGFVTEENAIEIFQYLMELHCNNLLNDNHYSKLYNLKLITQQNNLQSAYILYLSDSFKPDVKLEKYITEDLFVSRQYLSLHYSINSLKDFFEKIGVTYGIEWKMMTIMTEHTHENPLVYEDFVQQLFNISRKFQWESYKGWSDTGYSFSPSDVSFYGLPYLHLAENHDFAKMFWNNVLPNPHYNKDKDYTFVSGYTGFIPRSIWTQALEEKGAQTHYLNWAIQNHRVIPATDGQCYLAKDVYSNSIPKISEYIGLFLPILDCDTIIEQNWIDLLGLKNEITLQDYLSVLNKLINYGSGDFDIKELCSAIYDAITSKYAYLTHQQKEFISQWGKTNKILAKDGYFYSPSELSIVLVEGFANGKFAYTGKEKPTEDMIKLMRLLGVNIIDDVKPNYTGTPIENEQISSKLQIIAPLLTCLKDSEYEKALNKTISAINTIKFYQVEQIELTYGDNNDVIKKTVYAENNSVFFVGDWETIRVLNSIVEPIAKLLHIKQSNAKLLEVLLTSDINECVEYLEENGINVDKKAIKKASDNFNKQTEVSKLDSVELEAAKQDGSICSISLSDTSYAGLTKLQMAEMLTEAKQKVREELERQGYDFSKATGMDASTYGNIYGVVKDGEKYPLVVHSYKNNNRDFQLTAMDWEQLMLPNSMLYIVTHNGAKCVRFYELMKRKGLIRLSFDADNVDCKRRMTALAEILRYFKGLHFDFGSLQDTFSNVAERFNVPEKELTEFLKGDDADMLLS